MNQFLYILRLVPRLHDDSAWTEPDQQAVHRHLEYLQSAARERKVILAGRTLESGAQTFGLVILEAPDEPQARTFMQEDPGVRGGIMTAELHPYRVAVERA